MKNFDIEENPTERLNFKRTYPSCSAVRLMGYVRVFKVPGSKQTFPKVGYHSFSFLKWKNNRTVEGAVVPRKIHGQGAPPTTSFAVEQKDKKEEQPGHLATKSSDYPR